MNASAFLGRVRERLGGDRGRSPARAAPPTLPDMLAPTMVSGDGRHFERFQEQLRAIGGEARRVRRDELAEVVASVAAGARSAVLGTDLGEMHEAVAEGLVRAGATARKPTREAAEAADLGVTGAVLGVASTGSVLLASGPDSPRTAGLLPSAHIVVLPEDRIVPGFEELFDEMPRLVATSSALVLVSGPSRTSDIDMTPILGVHGPERVVVLVVSE